MRASFVSGLKSAGTIDLGGLDVRYGPNYPQGIGLRQTHGDRLDRYVRQRGAYSDARCRSSRSTARHSGCLRKTHEYIRKYYLEFAYCLYQNA